MKKYYCKKCLSHYTKKELFDKHITYCCANETVAVKMPPKNSYIYYKNHNKKFPLPFIVYADFECFTKPFHNCEPNPENSFTMEYQKHEPCGFCLYIKPLENIKLQMDPNPLIYTKKTEDEDIAKIFVKKLELITKSIYENLYKFPKKMIFTDQNRQDFNNSNICHICEQPFKKDDKKFRDYCHFTGEYRGA